MIDAIEIGYAIKDRRAELGLTQAQLAEAAGVSKRCLWSLELGQNPGVQLDKLTAVLSELGLNLILATTEAAKPAAHPAPYALQPKSDAAASITPGVSPSHHASSATSSKPSGVEPTAPSAPSDTTTATGNDADVIDALTILTGGSR